MSGRRHVRSSSPVPRHRRQRRLSVVSLIKPGTIGAALVAFAALLGLGGTAALWQDSATVAPSSLQSGSIGVQQAGFDGAGVEYSAGVSQKTTSLVLSNPGRSVADISASASITGSTSLASRVSIRIWAPAGADCAVSTPAGEAGTWAALKGVPATLAAKSSVTLCLQTTLNDRSTDVGASYSAQLTVVASRGSWRSSTTATVTQSLRAITPVSVGTCTGSGSGAYSARFDWPASPMAEPAKSNLRYNVTAGGKTYTPAGEPSGSWTQAQFAGDTARAQIGSGFFEVKIYERVTAANGAVSNGTQVASGWIEIGTSNEEPWARCASGPAPSSVTAKALTCRTPWFQGLQLSIDDPAGYHDQWRYDIVIGSQTLTSGLSHYSQTRTLSSAELRAIGSGTFDVKVVRGGLTYFTGKIRVGFGIGTCA